MMQLKAKHLSDEAVCLSDSGMLAIRNLPSTPVKAIQDHTGEVFDVAAVHVRAPSGGEYLADKQTGSMYSLVSMRCMTGAIRLVTQ